MTNLLKNGVKIIIGLIILVIALKLVGVLVGLAFQVAFIALLGGGLYLGAKKIGLLK